jgi:hypothetical protein
MRRARCWPKCARVMEASYDPRTGKATVTLDYREAQQIIACEDDSLMATLRAVLAGVPPPQRIVSIPRKRRQYAEPAPEAEALARREAAGRNVT